MLPFGLQYVILPNEPVSGKGKIGPMTSFSLQHLPLKSRLELEAYAIIWVKLAVNPNLRISRIPAASEAVVG